MALAERTKLYKAIEDLTGNPLISYATSRRLNATGIISGDVIEEFVRQIEAIEDTVDVIDVLIESNGGDGVVVWRLMSALRSKAKKIRVLVPHSAFSAATLFCLGADEIVMGKYGCLGPTDPQISVIGKDGQQKFFAFEDVLAFIGFVRSKLELSKEGRKDIYNRFFDSIEPFALGFATRSSALSTAMGAKLLQTHLKVEEKGTWSFLEHKLSKRKAHKISERFNKNFFNHGHPLNKDEVREIGLNVVDPGEELEELMWKVHLDLEQDFMNDTPFDILSNYLQNNAPLAPVGQQSPVGVYSYDLKFAVVESVRVSQEYIATYETTAFRNAQNLTYGSVNVVTKQGWKRQP